MEAVVMGNLIRGEQDETYSFLVNNDKTDFARGKETGFSISMSKLDNYIKQCEDVLKGFENLEEYEECAELLEFLNVLKTRNKERYIELSFDLKALAKVGFFGPTIHKAPKPLEAEERLKSFFRLNEIFDYSTIGDSRFCPFKDHLKRLEGAI